MRVESPDDVDLDDFRVVEEHKPYREWCVPAALINTHATVTLMSEDDVDERDRQRWFGHLGPERDDCGQP